MPQHLCLGMEVSQKKLTDLRDTLGLGSFQELCTGFSGLGCSHEPENQKQLRGQRWLASAASPPRRVLWMSPQGSKYIPGLGLTRPSCTKNYSNHTGRGMEGGLP